MPKRTSRRKCKEYEREWHGFCVDRNLKDDWLECLNTLDAFEMISICEGHCDRHTEPSRTPPHIKLRLKEQLLPDIASRWDRHKMAILSEVNRLFQVGDTYLNLELKFKLRSVTGKLSYQEDMIIRVHSRQTRNAEEMDAATHAWFEQSVERIQAMDRFVANLER